MGARGRRNPVQKVGEGFILREVRQLQPSQVARRSSLQSRAQRTWCGSFSLSCIDQGLAHVLNKQGVRRTETL